MASLNVKVAYLNWYTIYKCKVIATSLNRSRSYKHTNSEILFPSKSRRQQKSYSSFLKIFLSFNMIRMLHLRKICTGFFYEMSWQPASDRMRSCKNWCMTLPITQIHVVPVNKSRTDLPVGIAFFAFEYISLYVARSYETYLLF